MSAGKVANNIYSLLEMRTLSQKAYVKGWLQSSTSQGGGLPTAHTGLRAAPFSSGSCQSPERVLGSLADPLGSQQIRTGLAAALKHCSPECPLPPSLPLILVNHSLDVCLASTRGVLTLYWFGAGVSNLRPLPKLGSWNMLEQELLKSFFETKHDGSVYALAAGFLETMGLSRSRCGRKPEESALSHNLGLPRTGVRGTAPHGAGLNASSRRRSPGREP